MVGISVLTLKITTLGADKEFKEVFFYLFFSENGHVIVLFIYFFPIKTQLDGEKNSYHALYKILQKSSNIFYIKYMLNYLRYSQAMLQK